MQLTLLLTKKEKAPGYNSLDESEVDLEENNEISQLESGLAGVASGVLKIPEGFVSLGAELMDATGMSQNAAARVEQVFDTKGAAMAYAYELAEKHNVCAIIHSEDGKFESKECSPEDHPGILDVFFMNFKMYFNRL